MQTRSSTARMCVAAVLITMLVAGFPTRLLADACIASGEQLVGWPGGNYGYGDLSGKIHIRYCFSGSGFNEATEQAARAAINGLNYYSTQTNTEWDEDCGQADIHFVTRETTCGAYNLQDDVIFVSSDTQSAIAENSHGFETGVWLFEHELMHVLGLGEAGNDPNTVMRNLPQSAGQSCQDAVRAGPIPPPLTEDTATTAGGCVGTARSDNLSSPSDPPWREPIEDDCYDYYQTSYTYYCSNGGCTLMDVDTHYLGRFCGLRN
jgi:hypothetical protein